MSADRAYQMTATDSGAPVRLLPTERRPKDYFLTLTPNELEWLNEFRKRLLAQLPAAVADIIVHGYRVRGLADEDLWMEVLVVINDEHEAEGENVREIALDVSMINHSYQRVEIMLRSERADGTGRASRPYWRQELAEGISVM